MNEEEIANLVTRLSLDVEDLERGRVQAIALGTAIGTGIKDAIEGAAQKAVAFGKQVLGAFAQAEEGSIKLDAAIKAGGHNIESTRAKYDAFAEAIQKVTVLDDDAVLSILKTAESYKLSGDAATKATKDAISLAAINDSNAQSMIRMTAAMAKGDTHQAMMFARMIPQLRGIKDEQKFVAEYSRLVAAGFDQAQANAGSFSGIMAQMHNALENLYEDFGKIVADALRPFVKGFQLAIDWMKEFSEASKTIIVAIGGITVAVSALTAAGVVLDFVFSPVVLTIGAVVASVTLLTAGLVFMEEQTRVFSDSWKMLLPLFEDVHDLVQELTGKSFRSLTDMLKTVRPFLMLVAIGFKEALAVAIKIARMEVEQLKTSLGPLPGLLSKVSKALGLAAGPEIQNLGKILDLQDVNKQFAQRRKPKEEEAMAASGHGEAQKNVVSLQKSVVSLTTSLQEQVATFGMSSRAASIFKLEMQGASEQELAAAHHAAQTLATRERANALTQDIVNQAAALQGETESIRASTQALEQLRGAHGNTATARKEALQIAKEQIEVDKLLARGATADEVEILKQKQKANRAAQKNLEQTQEGLDLMEKYKSPMQKFAEEQAHLQELFNTGKIDADTYRKAISDLQKQIAKPAENGINASLFGSNESLAKIEATRAALRAAKVKMPGVQTGLPSQGTAPIVSQTLPAGGGVKEDSKKMLEYLKELVELARAKANQVVLEVEAAGLL